MDKLGSNQAGMEIVSNKVCITRHQSLQIDNVVALVRAFDALNLDWASDFYTFIVSWVNHFVDFDVQSLSN